MLYWIWFFVLSALSWSFVFIANKIEDDGLTDGLFYVMAFMFGLVSIVIPHPVTLAAPFNFLIELLPQTGEWINNLTAVSICFLYAFTWISLPFFIFNFFPTLKRKLRNR